MPNAYTALTIGPIYKTMSQARKTRHLWGSSYLFSYLMKQIIKLLLGKNVITEEDILLPHSTTALREGKEFYGTGLFPDRLIMQTTNKEALESAIKTVEKEIIDELITKAGNEYASFFKNYFRIYFTSFNLPDSTIKLFTKPEDNENIVMVGNKLLDSLELREKYHTDISEVDWKEIIDKLNGNKFLYKDAFGTVKNDYEFPYLVEIATDDFRQRGDDLLYESLIKTYLKDETEAEQQNFLNALRDETKKIPSPFHSIKLKAYHKYIAVVQADGDNIGATIGKIGNDPIRIREFSKALGQFAIAATKAIKYFGGKPVYIGGDDLLFFAPVAINNNENNVNTIFELTKTIDDLFKENLISNNALIDIYHEQDEKGNFKIPKPSLSYGISITYSKYPLNEARESAYQLMKEAKSVNDDKNKICFKILKHSGQGLGFTIDKKKVSDDWENPRSFDTFLNMTSRIPLEKLHSVRDLLNKVAFDKERLKALFDNTFNEPIHDKKLVKEYLSRVQLFIHQLFLDFPDDIEPLPDYETEQRKSNLQKIYSTLRFVKFVTDDIND
jgi:CRISPR-associated protein Cmr2